MRQLILDLIPAPPPTLENFAAGANAAALTALAAWLAPENRETCLFLWGEAGAGKTHLLRACTDSAFVDAVEDPSLASLTSLAGDAAEEARFLSVDNVEALAADGQVALFNHFNRLRATGGRLLAAASLPPLQLRLREDLRTRLGSGLIYRLHALSEDARRAALAAQAARRGMNLAPEALDYLLARAPRDMRSLSAILAALDRHSLELKRPLTLPLLRDVLQTSPDTSATG